MTDLIRHLPAVIYEYAILPDGKRSFTYVSPASEIIFGLLPEQILRDVTLMDDLVHPDDLKNLEETSHEAESGGKEWNWQGRFVIGDKIKWVEIRSNHEVRPDK